MLDTPSVSVVIPCYNGRRYLARAVASIERQTVDSWEVIIVDDGSADDSAAVAERLIAERANRNIRLIRQANSGVAAARNAGVAAATGRYILPLDVDDVIAPRMLEATLAVLESEPGIDIAYTDVFLFTDENLAPQPWPACREYDPRLLRNTMIMQYCSLYRRAMWEAVGGYDETLSGKGEDWDFWLSCAERGHQARRVPEPLFGYNHKDTGVHVGWLLDQATNHARLVVEHASLYRPVTVDWARAVLEGVDDERCPDEILTRADEHAEVIRTVLDLRRVLAERREREKLGGASGSAPERVVHARTVLACPEQYNAPTAAWARDLATPGSGDSGTPHEILVRTVHLDEQREAVAELRQLAQAQGLQIDRLHERLRRL